MNLAPIVMALASWGALVTWLESVRASDAGVVHVAALAAALLVFGRDRAPAVTAPRLVRCAWVLLAAYAAAAALAPRSLALTLAFAAIGARLAASTREPARAGGLLVLFAAALPFGEIAQAVVGVPLRILAAALAALLLRASGLVVEHVGVGLRDGDTYLFVDPACGGLRFLASTFVLAGLLAAVLRLRPRATCAVVAGAGITAVAANALRTSALFWLERSSVPGTWRGTAHEGAGLAAFSCAALALALFAWSVRPRERAA